MLDTGSTALGGTATIPTGSPADGSPFSSGPWTPPAPPHKFHWKLWQKLLVAGVSLLIVGGVVAGAVGSKSSTTNTANSASAGASWNVPAGADVPSLDNALAPWTQYIANNESSGMQDWAAAVGTGSPVYQLPINAAQVFWQERYSVGTAQASNDAYASLKTSLQQFLLNEVPNGPYFNASTIPAPPA
jgi:multidrug efflux pump subunit AcrB